MSLIQKMLAAECLDPCGEVCFVVVLRCVSEVDIDRCKAVFAPLDGSIHIEKNNAGYLFLFMASVGADAHSYLVMINRLLDDQQEGIDLVETKNVNLKATLVANHSFVFRQQGESDDRTIILSPSHAFGSGEHPSTGLAIEFLEERAPLNCNVLDVGCGTGVLSLVALKLGAETVLGVDIDEEGIRGAQVNATLNHLGGKSHFENLQLGEITQSYPLILANLTYSVLQYLLEDLTSLADPDGILIVSGLQGRQGDDAACFLHQAGWHVSQRKSAGKWQAFLAERLV